VRHGHRQIAGRVSQLLNHLLSRASIPEYQVRWSSGSPATVVPCGTTAARSTTQCMDYWPAPRKMERAAIIGDIPY
jgi:taurine dioxygenase